MSMPNVAQQNSTAPKPDYAFPEAFEGTARALHAQLASAAAIPQAVLGANLSIVSELLTFMGQRVKAQAELWNSLGHCKEFSEIVDAQRAFTEQVTRDYSKEVSELSELVRRNVASLSEIGAQSGPAPDGKKWDGKEKLAA